MKVLGISSIYSPRQTVFGKKTEAPIYNSSTNPKPTNTENLCQIQSMQDACNSFENKKILNYLLNNDLNAENGVVLDIKKGFINKLALKLATSNKPIMIAVCGESASGKSTLTKIVQDYADKNNSQITFLSTDNYFKDLSKQIKKFGSFDNVVKSGYDLDSPNNFYLKDLRANLIDLKSGKKTKGREYQLNGTATSVKDAVQYNPNKIIFVEGTVTMLDGIRELFDATIYVEADEKTREKRFMQRAHKRDQGPKEALVHWNYVKEAGKKYVQPLKEKCDVVIDGEFDKDYMKDTVQILSKLNCKF